ncbi:MAG: guanylate kinase [Saprospiraceae bacterium]|nr:guanylate kinase [Saprospiraceae bacterium]NNK81466.1 guanylate kinase [Flavobacteriales bacterium]
MEKKIQGKVFVFTAPSGAGKTTIVKHLLKVNEDLDFSISATSRSMRKDEIDGRDYYFLDGDTFQQKITERAFLEWEEVYSNQFYGTLHSEIRRIWDLQKHIIFDVDVKGAVDIKDHFGDQCLSIFVKPPSLQILMDRLKKRGTETPSSLHKRVARIRHELTYEQKFDRVIVNDLLDVALKEAEFLIEDFLVS